MRATVQDQQIQAAMAAMGDIFEDALRAVYLHGSAVAGGLRPQSDIDLLAVVEHAMSDGQRQELTAKLLEISGRHPPLPGGRRCVELMVFLVSDLRTPHYPTRSEFIYGEWLRDVFEAGGRAMPARNPENTLLLAQARRRAHTLFGPDAAQLLSEMSAERIRRAMRDLLPALLQSLRGDERNVLLTLARMWRTAVSGEFVAKDAAAAWAAPQMPGREAETLALARDGYLGVTDDDWGDHHDAAARAADYLRERISAHL